MSTYEQFVLIGKNEGKTEGKTEANMRTVKRLSAKGFTIVEIADCMDLPIEEVKKLVEKIQQEAVKPEVKKAFNKQ